MISSKAEYLDYIEKDKLALGIEKKSRITVFLDPIYKFQRIMRKLDYFENCYPWRKLSIGILKYRYFKAGIRLGYSMPYNKIGPGLCLAHHGSIIISHNSTIGSFCKIHSGVNIGATNGKPGAPQIGNFCYIGPGEKLIGDITIADYAVIGANAVVVHSICEKGTYAGIPAKKISNNDSLLHLREVVE